MKKKTKLLIMLLSVFLISFNPYRSYFFENFLDKILSSALYLPLKVQASLANAIQEKIDAYQMQKNTYEIENYHDKESLIAQLIQSQSMLQFVEETQEMQQFASQYKTEHKILAQIITKNFSDEGHFYLIDAGSLKGITENMIAVYKNCLLGRVIKVYPHYSKIMLLTDSECKIAAYLPSTKIKGILQGTHDSQTLTLNHFEKIDSVKKGDLLLSSGEGLIFPRGFGLGNVQYVCKDDTQPTIKIMPLIPLQSINYCYLIQKGQST